MTARMTAILMYWASVGWAPCSPACPPCSTASSSTTSELTSTPDVAGRGDQVHDGEDHDPHHVHEVPVEARDLHHLGLLLGQLPSQRQCPQRQQHDDAEGDVHAVEAGEDEEAGPE